MIVSPYVGVTGRGRLDSERRAVQHASTGLRRTRTGKTLRAFCGVGVYELAIRFDPTRQRACRRCAHALAGSEQR